MSRISRGIIVGGTLVVAASALSAQTQTPPPASPPAQPPAQTAPADPPLPGPPIRRIESAQSISTEPLGAINGVRALSNGRVLVNDGTRRRLLLMDSTLTNVVVVLDSLTEVANAYGTRAGTLFAYRGDSSIFVDPATLAMLILDGEGRIARVRAVPRAQDINSISSPTFSNGVPGFDAKGRFIYRINAQNMAPIVALPNGMPNFPSPPDSAFVVAVDLDTRKSDTLGVVRIPRVVFAARMEPDGGFSLNVQPNPLPLTDDWGVLPDGTVAFLRGLDYRVEYRAPDGTMRSSAKLPFPWVRMAEEDKQKFADSAKTVQVKSAQTNFATQMIAWSNLLNKPYPASFTMPEGYVPPPGLPKDWILPKGVSFPANYVPACPPGTAAATPGMPPVTLPGGGTCTSTYFADMYGGGYTPPAPTYRPPVLVRPSDLPDYRPPFSVGAARADADGNLWVRTIPMGKPPAGALYDIIDKQGELVDRIQLPAGFTLTGFGPGKVVYLSNRDAKGLHVSRVRLR
jgi:hypothetical protein